MKKPEELGISPAPWKVVQSATGEQMICEGVPRGVMEIHCTPKAGCEAWKKIAVVRFQAGGPEEANAHMTAAAPELYDKAYKVADNLRVHLAVPTQSITMNRAEVEAMAKELEAALAKASGESEAFK